MSTFISQAELSFSLFGASNTTIIITTTTKKERYMPMWRIKMKWAEVVHEGFEWLHQDLRPSIVWMVLGDSIIQSQEFHSLQFGSQNILFLVSFHLFLHHRDPQERMKFSVLLF
jgi:hypothetical protein